jgi:hypothetical protein
VGEHSDSSVGCITGAMWTYKLWEGEGEYYSLDKPRAVRVTGGLLSNLGGFVIRIRIPCIVHVSCMYHACIVNVRYLDACPVHI